MSRVDPNDTLDERIAKGRAEHSCLMMLDEFMYCMSLTNQFGKYYRDNTWDDCPGMLDSWTRCIKGKLAKKDRAEQLKLEEVRKQRRKFEGVHVFTFREGYRQTAAKLYGVGLPPGDDAAAPGEAQGG